MSRYDTGSLSDTHRWVVDAVPAGASVLETGCNTGYMTRALADKGCRVTAVDLDPALVEAARPHAASALVLDLDRQPLTAAGGPFEAVTYADVLEHVQRPVEVLRATHDVLAAGGRVVLSTPNIAFWRIRTDLLRGRFTYTDTGILDRTHLHFWTEDTLRELVVAAGFRVVELRHVPGPRPAATRPTPRWVAAAAATGYRALHARAPKVTAQQFVVVAEADPAR